MLNKRILVLMFLVLFLFLAGCNPAAPPIDENQAPVITSTPVSTATVGEIYYYNVGATDPDGDTLTFLLTAKPVGMIINLVGLISWVPAVEGVYNVTVMVSDGVLSDTQSFTIVVEKPCVPPCPPPVPPVNHAPIITSIPGDTAIVGVEYTYTIKATDPEGDAITYYLVSEHTGMTFDGIATISWTPTVEGSYSVIVGASDGKKATTQSFTITVEAVELTGIKVDPDKKTLLNPGTQYLIVTAYYNDGSNADVTLDCIYVSSDPGKVGVTALGLVEAWKFGKVTITVTYTPNGIVFGDTVEVTVGPVHNVTQDTYHNTIQAAINDALTSAGDIIKVAAGTYNEVVTISKQLTLLGANAGVCAGVDSGTRGDESIVDAFKISVNDVTVDGFQINGTKVGGSGDATNAIVLDGRTSGHTISNNILLGPGGTPPAGTDRGIVFGYTVSNTTVVCNEIYGWVSGTYINPSSDLLFQYNSIHDNWAGIGSDGLSDVRILNNNFSDNVEGFGSSSVGSNVEAHSNNFTINVTGICWYSGNNIDATNNWWGDESGPYHPITNPLGAGDTVSDNVGYIPWSTSQY